MSLIQQNMGAIYDGSQRLIAPVLNSTTATKNWAVGEEFILDGNLYKVTTAISSGNQIIVSGSSANCELADTVTEQIISMGEKVKYKVESFDSVSTAVSSITGINIPISDPTDATNVLARIPLTTSPRDSSAGLTGMWVSTISSIAVRVIVAGNHAAQQYNATILYIYE